MMYKELVLKRLEQLDSKVQLAYTAMRRGDGQKTEDAFDEIKELLTAMRQLVDMEN